MQAPTHSFLCASVRKLSRRGHVATCRHPPLHAIKQFAEGGLEDSEGRFESAMHRCKNLECFCRSELYELCSSFLI